MSSPDSIRRATLADARALTEIRRCAILELASATLGEAEAARWANSAAEDRVAGAIERHEVWLLERSGSPQGWVEIDGGRIEGLYVRPDSSQRGLGSKLLAHAESRIELAGHANTMLDASANAKVFYLGRGYEVQSSALADGSIPMRKSLAR